jgi:hypothetical protein
MSLTILLVATWHGRSNRGTGLPHHTGRAGTRHNPINEGAVLEFKKGQRRTKFVSAPFIRIYHALSYRLMHPEESTYTRRHAQSTKEY